MPYQIIDWDSHFENDRSRTRKKCSFVCVPNKQSGMGLSYVLKEPDGPAIYGIWHLLLGACSKQPRRNGWLTMNGEQAGSAWGVSDLSVKFHLPEILFERALEVLCSEKVGWIIWVESPSSHHTLTVESPRGTLKEGKKEEKEGNGACEPPAGFPKSEKEAIEAGMTGGVDPETCRECYHKAVGRGYRDGADVPIRNFPGHVKSVSMRKQADRVEKGLPAKPRAPKEKTSKDALLIPALQTNGPARWTMERPPIREHFKRDGDYEIVLDAFGDWMKKRANGFYENA